MLNIFKHDAMESLQKELLKDYLDSAKVIKLLKNNQVDINKRNEKGQTLLFNLVRRRRIESIKILIKHGINVNIEDNFGKTVLSEAVERGDGMMIRFLLDNGASLDFINSSGRTIIQDVALEENFKVFEILMTHNPNLNIIDNYGRTVLFDAVMGGNINIVREVINNIENPNILDNDGQTALFSSVLKEDLEVAKFLVENGVDVNITDESRENILFNAITLGAQNIDFIELLIDNGIKLNIKNKDGETILDEILKILSIVKDPNQKIEGKYKLVRKDRDYLKLTSVLIDNGLAINRVDSKGKTILQKEVERENYETIEFLLASGTDINCEDKLGKTVLFHAILKGYSNIHMIEYLIERDADIDHRDVNDRTIIDDLIEIILIQENNKKPSSRILFNLPSEEDYFALLKRMLINKPKINIPRHDGRTTIFDVVVYNNLELIKMLLNAGADLNIVDNERHTPLSIMVDEGLNIRRLREKELFLERLVFLLKFRIDIDAVDDEGRTVIHRAVIADDVEVIEKLLSKKANLSIKDKQGRTALHHTQWKGNYKIARLLIVAGADVNATDYAGFTVLNYAAILGHTKLVMILIASGVFMYNKAKKSKSVAQFFKGKEENLSKLLASDITDEKMRSAIAQVIQNLKTEISEALR